MLRERGAGPGMTGSLERCWCGDRWRCLMGSQGGAVLGVEPGWLAPLTEKPARRS